MSRNLFTSIAIFSLFLSGTIGLSAQPSDRIVIDSGHNTSIGAMILHSSGALLSADNDGLVKVWDLETNTLTFQVNTGASGSIQLKVHPERKEFALLVSRPGFTEISVWDWEQNKILFKKELSERPIQFEYSGKGNYLFLTRISSPSIILLDSRTGRNFSYPRRMEDLFSFGYIGASESTIMTYGNSGVIKYWDIRTSSLKSQAATVADMHDISVLQTEGKRYLSARKDNTLYLIDRLNGNVRDSISIEDLKFFNLDPDSGILSAASQSPNGRIYLTILTTKGAFFTPLAQDPLVSANPVSLEDNPEPVSDFFFLNGELTANLIAKGRVFLSDDNGIIWEYNPQNGTPEIFKKNRVAEVKDLNFINDTLYILSSSDLIEFKSNGFSTTARMKSLSDFSDFTLGISDSPLPGDSEIEPVDDEKMIIWTRDSVQNGYVLYDPVNHSVLNSNYNFDSPLSQIHVRNDQVLVLEYSGEASLNNIHTGFRDFQFSALGMVSLNFLNDNTLLGGKSLMKSGKNPMFTVQTDTGEIIPLLDDRFLIYDIFSPGGSNRTFTIGLKQLNNTVETVIESHNTNNPSTSATIFSLTGEWVNSKFTADTSSYTPTLYGTVSGREIIRLAGTRKRSWSYDKDIQKIFFHNSLLYILNTDGSLTLFDPLKGVEILDFYLMEDGSWITIPGSVENQPLISDKSASAYFNTFNSMGRRISNSYLLKK